MLGWARSRWLELILSIGIAAFVAWFIFWGFAIWDLYRVPQVCCSQDIRI